MEPVRERFGTDPELANLLTPGYFKLLPPSSFSCKLRHTAFSHEHVKRSKDSDTQLVSIKQPGAKTDDMSKETSCSQETSTPKPSSVSNSAVQVATDPSKAWQLQDKVDRTPATSKTTVCVHSNLSSSRKPEGHSEPAVICATYNEKTVVSKQLQSQTHAQVEGKENPAGKISMTAKDKFVLLSSGKQLHISAEGTPRGKFQKHLHLSGNGDQRGPEIAESLEHDNYYNFAASGLCAIAAVKPEWEYDDDTGRKQFERSLQETHVGKMNKQLEYYNTSFIKQKALRSRSTVTAVGSSHRRSPPAHVKQPLAQQKPLNSSHEKVLHSIPQPEGKCQPPIRREVNQPRPQTAAVQCQAQNGTEPLSRKMEAVVAVAPSKVSSSKPTPRRPLNPPHPSRSSRALPTSERISTKGRSQDLIATGAVPSPPRLEVCQALGVEGHQQKTEPLNDLGGDDLNDLSEATSSSSSVGEVAVGMHIGGGQVSQ